MHATLIPFPRTEACRGDDLEAPLAQRRNVHLADGARTANAPSIWSAVDHAISPNSTDHARATARSVAPLAPALEAELLSILTRPLAPGESHQRGSANRESELYAVLGRLDVAQAFQLGRRLDAARPGDVLVAAFGRMLIERRQRIRAFVADTRRRVALGR
jgi:hypothetical protein